ncbi:MAG TPA: glycosyltransferase [Kofleriaceae bacterium]|nr:glycosyltransferase [Kofleriaceae bacterium]
MATPIIAFSKDWHEDPTSNHHVLRELAKTRRVLWLNSLATRKPKITNARDLGKIKRKLSEFARGAVNVENDLWVATPLVLPLPQSELANRVNRQILRFTVQALRAQLRIDRFHLITFLPNAAPYIDTLGEDLALYYCVDEWATFPGLDRESTLAMERRLLERVDATFTTSLALRDKKSRHCASTFLAPHGVDYRKFARALDDELQVPADLAALPGPVIGFFGTLRPFLDYELMAYVAKARPDWSFALIGQKMCDIGALASLPNVHLLGQKSHDELPAYCKGFDVGLIPYRIDDEVKFINPLKLREYLSAGLPVVSTNMPEVQPYAHLCHIADTGDEMVAAIERALGEGSRQARLDRSALMQNETWEARVAAIEHVIEQLESREAQTAHDDLIGAWPVREQAFAG